MGTRVDTSRGVGAEAFALYTAWLKEAHDQRRPFAQLCAEFPDLQQQFKDLHALTEIAHVAPLQRSLAGLFGEDTQIRLSLEDAESASTDSEAMLPSATSGPAAHGPDAASTVDRYDLQGEVARGGVGIVYKVRDRQLDRTWAMKVMLCEPGSSVGQPSDP